MNVYQIKFEILLSSNVLLNDLLVDGVSIANFSSTQFEYTYRLFPGSAVPEVTYEKALEDVQRFVALLESDGITVVDFKTDYVTEETLPQAVDRYRPQVQAYAQAMERIYQLPLKQALLYFFHMDRFVAL